jgi:predicted DNA-binding protein (MmcQ/YjbR family)
MLIDIETIFKYKVPNRDKLLDYGFSENGGKMQKRFPIVNNQFAMAVAVGPDGAINYKVIDNALQEEYVLVRVEGADGAYVNTVRTACEKVLCDIARECFDTEILKAEQTRRMLGAIKSGYGTEPEFLWSKFPDYAAFRRKDNAKWFAIIMTVDRSKLCFKGHGNIEIIDIKAEPCCVESLLRQDGYYPAYHMNKKHWFTVCLDGSVSDQKLLSLIAASYKCAANG